MQLKQINIFGYPVQVPAENADAIAREVDRLVRLDHAHRDMLDRYDALSERMRGLNRAISVIHAAHDFVGHVIEDSLSVMHLTTRTPNDGI